MPSDLISKICLHRINTHNTQSQSLKWYVLKTMISAWQNTYAMNDKTFK